MPVQMPAWNAKLAYLITPKRGPVRAMDTLLDANHAITQDLPVGWLRRPHWGAAGKLLLAVRRGRRGRRHHGRDRRAPRGGGTRGMDGTRAARRPDAGTLAQP